VIIAAMLLGIGLNFTGLDPIKALIYSAVLNGLISPVMIFFIIRLSKDERVMGRWKSGTVSTILGWLTFTLITLSGIGAIISLGLG
jgi:Mn2+/Fe2+ NRAMP family transporter